MKLLRRFVLSVLLCFMVYTPVYTKPDFPVSKTALSVMRLSDGSTLDGPHCTAWAITPTTFVTAFHCHDIDPVFLGSNPAKFILFNQQEDLALVTTTSQQPMVMTPLKIASKAPQSGQQVLAMGYAADFPVPMSTLGVVGNLEALWSIGSDAPAPRMSFGGSWVDGMSGGPIINRDGEVVSVVICGSTIGLSCGARYEAVKGAVKAANTVENSVHNQGT